MDNGNNKVSFEIMGVFISIGGILLASWGFSDTCSSEIANKIIPLLGSLPGLATTYFARLKRGGVSALGVKK